MKVIKEGNYYIINNKVRMVDEYDVKQFREGYIDCQNAPLTEEVLRMFGFVKNKNPRWDKGEFRVYWNKDYRMFWGGPKIDDVYKTSAMPFVHNIQDVYREAGHGELIMIPDL